MQAIAILFGLFVFFTAVILPWVALAKATEARRLAEKALDEVTRRRREHEGEGVPRYGIGVIPAGSPAPSAPVHAPVQAAPAQARASAAPSSVATAETGLGGALRAAKPPEEAAAVAAPLTPASAGGATPPPAPPPLPERKAPLPARGPAPVARAAAEAKPPAVPAKPAFDWERFMGVNLFAWVGGFALFLGVAFGIKYSFELDLIPPAVRAAFGFLFGAGLIGGALRLDRSRYAVTVHTLCGAGTVILYAVTFACRAVWKFEFFGPTESFLLMSLITAAAFTLAVRLEAGVAAVLGLAGGFLTPVLLSTGEDNPLGLFGYMALLNAGLLAVAVRRDWRYLPPLGALGTVCLSIGWMDRFYHSGSYWTFPACFVPMAAGAVPATLFLAAARGAAKRSGDAPASFGWSALAAFGVPVVVVLAHLGAPRGVADSVSESPAMLFAYLLLVEAAVLALAVRCRAVRAAVPLAGAGVFLTLGGWMSARLTEANLPVALALVFAYTAVHLIAPAVLRRRGLLDAVPAWMQFAGPVGLVLALLPVAKLDGATWLLFPALLGLDLLVVVFAIFSSVLWPVVAALALTVVGVGAVLLDGACVVSAGAGLIMLGGFAAAFVAAGLFLMKRMAREGVNDPAGIPAEALPVMSVIMPFLLLILAAMKLAPANPSAVFGLGLLLVIVVLALARHLRLPALVPVGLGGAAALSYAWHGAAYDRAQWVVALAWHLVFAGVFSVYPWVFRREFARHVAPWVGAALAFPAYFWLILKTLQTGAPGELPGLIPAACALPACALPACAALAAVVRRPATDMPVRLDQLALYAGVALGFVTLIFPIQFEKQWLTVAWALEGAALVALHRRVPHRGLLLCGGALLAIAFARLGLNPEVPDYHPRAAMPLLNWYLYAYGVVAVSLFSAAKRWPAAAEGLPGAATGLLRGGACWLLFVLLNLEIADYFSEPGTLVRLTFTGHFARDMSYSLGWGLFSVAMLVAGLRRRERAARYAAIGLMALTLLKLFLHDLANLNQLYRIGAFIGVAALAMGISFLYQKFLSAREAGETSDSNP